MDQRRALIKMLRMLLDDTVSLYQQGAGYYSCIPIIHRYNKLLAQARRHFPDPEGLIDTFEDQSEKDPSDPADKMTVMQGIRVEVGQLITLLEELGEQKAEKAEQAEESA